MKLKSILLLLIFFSQFVSSQRPGGVKGWTYWLKGNVLLNGQDTVENKLNYYPALKVESQNMFLADKQKLKPNFTFFIVYTSKAKKETKVLDYFIGNNRIEITNKKVVLPDGFSKKEIKNDSFAILAIDSKNNYTSGSSLNLISFKAREHKKEALSDSTDIYEFIYFPKVIMAKERDKIMSYLSIKYGISLIEGLDYFDSKGKKIWDNEKNKEYSRLVTGIGIDDNSGLDHKKSTNYLEKGFVISMKDGVKELKSPSFLLIGASKDLKQFKESPSGLNILNKKWKLQITEEPSFFDSLTFTFDPFLFFDKETADIEQEQYVLVFSSTPSFETISSNRLYNPKIKDKKLIFDGITYKDIIERPYFTFIKAAEFRCAFDFFEDICNTSNVNVGIQIIGGTPPYTLYIKGNKGTTSVETEKTDYTLAVNDNAVEQIRVVDKNGKECLKTIAPKTLNTTENNFIYPVWFIGEEGEVVVKPKQSHLVENNYNFDWYKDAILVGNGISITLKEVGIYSLKISSKEGCSVLNNFTVLKDSGVSSSLKLYPNPVKSQTDFTIYIGDLPKETFDVSIYTTTGVFVSSKKINTRDVTEYKDNILVAGEYIIIFSASHFSTTKKLIVY